MLAVVAFIGGLSFETQAVWRAAGNVQSVSRQANGVMLTLSSGARVAITFESEEVIRVRLSPRGTFERDFSYAIAPAERKPIAAIVREVGRDRIEITTQAAGPKVVIQRHPFLVGIYDAKGQLLVEDDPLHPASFDPQTGEVEVSKKRDYLELYYGFGEKALPTARQGKTMTMWNTDTYSYPPGLDPIYESIPFFIALRQGRAYGIFFDNTYRTRFDMGNTAPERYTFGAAGGDLNYYVFTGGADHSPRRVLGDYTALTGRTPLPPLWAIGYQQSRYSYYPEARVREIARNFRERHIPADVLYLDIHYMDGYRIFTWDHTRFPDPVKMLRDLRDEGFHTVVIIDPGIKIDENYTPYLEGRAGGFFVKTPEGTEYHSRVWPGLCAFPDFTDPKVRAWFGTLYKKNLDEGVSGFWNDMNEPGTFGQEETPPPQPELYHNPNNTLPLNARHAGDGIAGDHARYHNVYGMQMARTTFEGVRNLRPTLRPFVLTRAGYAGVQRYSAVWTGDNVPSWDHLQLSIAMLTNMGVSGVPFVGADVGGFSGDASAELYTRWLQAASLTPFFRSHVVDGAQDREPWSFGPEYEKINRATIELRYQLLPYIYSLFHEHQETGAPVMRPLWFNYPSDYATYNPSPATEEYMLGSDLLVAPVLTPGALKRTVYFPKGDAWMNWWTGELYTGGTKAEIAAPLDRLPLFARVGATIPVQPVIQSTGEMAQAPLSLVVVTAPAQLANPAGSPNQSEPQFFNIKTESRIYEDAGDGYEYQNGAFSVLTVTQSGNTIRFSRTGAYRGARRPATLQILNINKRPSSVRINGHAVENFTFDTQAKRLELRLPAEAVEEISITQ